MDFWFVFEPGAGMRRKNVLLAFSLELGDGSQLLSGQGSGPGRGKGPNGVCSMDVKLFLLFPVTRFYFLCTLLGTEAVLQVPVCKEEAQGRQVPGVWARQVLGGLAL